ncbi:MAG: TRAP transporter small permease [Parvularculaceae bacterium]
MTESRTLARLERLDAKVRRVCDGLAFAGVAGLLLQAFLILFDALMRWLFSSPVQGVEDLSGLLITIIVATFFPAVLIGRQNIRAAIAGRFVGARAAAWLDVFGHAVLLAFFAIIAWQFAAYAVDARMQTTHILRLPTAPALWAAAAIIAFCVPVQALVLALETAKALRMKKRQA